jgi:hypothetical protein
MADAIGARLWLARSDEEGSEFALFVPDQPPKAGEGSPGGEEGQSITASV